LNQAT